MARQNIIFEGLFEGSNPFNGWLREVETGTVVQSTEQKRSGTSSAKFRIYKPDVPNGQRGRIELKPPHETQYPCERWYGIAVFLPTGFQKESDSESEFQWHNDGGPSNAAPNMTMQITNNTWKLTNASSGTPANREWSWGAIKTGAWTDIVFHIKWTWQNDGFIQVWKDGVKPQPDYNGPTCYNPPAKAPYFKVGIHKWPWESNSNPIVKERIIYIDDVRVGNEKATFDDVKPGDSTTPPPPVNLPPTANAGGDQTIKLPVNSVALAGTASDSDGTIASYKWEKISGGAATIGNTSSASTMVSALLQGAYEFKLTVTDNKGATASDNVKVTVQPADTVPAPITVTKISITKSDNSTEQVWP